MLRERPEKIQIRKFLFHWAGLTRGVKNLFR